MTVLVWVGVAVLGGVGALSRWTLDGLVSARWGREFPLGTLAVNLTGAFTLGLLVGAGVQGHLLLLVGVAALGSYTTFSTWMFESHRLGEDGERRLAAANLAVSLAAGLLAALAGWALGEAW
jgi:fluoride exporter